MFRRKQGKESEMNTVEVRWKKIREEAKLPQYGSEDAAGADLFACLDGSVLIEPGETVLIPTGFQMAVPKGYAGLIYARSGLASKQGLAPANKVGVVDADYRGEVMVALHNHSDQERVVQSGDRIAQLVITPYLRGTFTETDELDDTVRGEGGFGSTGK